MNIESFRDHCLAKKGVTEEFPFGSETVVFKVMGKMFALANVEVFDGINLKCDPEEGARLREEYTSVQPAYHMNKKHWITVVMDGGVSDKLVTSWIDTSYQLVVLSLTKTQQKQLEAL